MRLHPTLRRLTAAYLLSDVLMPNLDVPIFQYQETAVVCCVPLQRRLMYAIFPEGDRIVQSLSTVPAKKFVGSGRPNKSWGSVARIPGTCVGQNSGTLSDLDFGMDN